MLYGHSWTWAQAVRLHIVVEDCIVESPECSNCEQWTSHSESLHLLKESAQTAQAVSELFYIHIEQVWPEFVEFQTDKLIYIVYETIAQGSSFWSHWHQSRSHTAPLLINVMLYKQQNCKPLFINHVCVLTCSTFQVYIPPRISPVLN